MLSRETYSGRRDYTITKNGITSGISANASQVEGVKQDYDPLPSSLARREQPIPSSSNIYTHASRNNLRHRPTDGLFTDQITSPYSSSAPRRIRSQNRDQPEEMDPYDFKLQQHLQKNGIAHKPLSNHRRQHDNEGQDRNPRPRSKQTYSAEDPYQDTSKRRECREGRELSSSKLHSSQTSESIDRRNKSLQKSTHEEPLTIRDIIDNREIRNEIDELRLSTSSNRLYPSSSSPSRKHGDVQKQSGEGHGESRMRKPFKGHKECEGTRDFSIDQSMLEKKFRAKLDAVIDVQPLALETTQIRSPISQDQERQDRADSYPYPRSPATQRRQRDLYHSSYSPSDFSQIGGDNDDDDDEERTMELKPGQHGIISSTPVQMQAPLLIQTNPAPASKSKRSKKRPKETNTVSTARPEDPGYDSTEGISFEREVAIAKAKRELGASINGPGPSSAPARQQPERPASSKLDHGRSLELGDLVSPTSYKFGGQGGGHNNLITRPARPSTGLPLPSAAPLPLNITGGLTGLDTQRFMELAGTLGEGQAVGSVLGTLKAMIRDLKAERKKSNATISLLQKDLKKAKREVDKANQSKERLSKALSKSTSSSKKSNGDSRRLGSGSLPEDSEQERIHAGIQRERDQVEENLVMLQKRIAAQEEKMAEMHARDKVRIQQVEHLKELMDTETEEEEVEEESEDEVEDDEEKMPDRGGFRDDCDRDGESADEMMESTKQQKGSKDDGAGVLKSSRSGKWASKSTRATVKRDKSRQAPLDSRRLDKVEEVHIHHHVHYSDEEDEDYYEIRPRHTEKYSTMRSNARYNYPDDHRSHIAPRQSYRAPPGTIQIPVRDIMSHSYPGQRSRHPLYDDNEQKNYRTPPHRFRRSQGHSITQGFAGNNRAHALEDDEHLQREVGARRAETAQQTDTATSTSTQTEVETPVVQPRQPLQPPQQSSLPSQRPPEIAPQAEHRTIPVNIPLAAKAPQKKLSIDIQRILSLLKTHDPTRCTVCQSGESHHHQHSGLRIDGRPIVVRRKKPVPEAVKSTNSATGNSSPRETSRHKPETVMARSTATTLHDLLDESVSKLESEVESFLSSLETNILDETQDGYFDKEREKRAKENERDKDEKTEDNDDDDDHNEEVDRPSKPHDMKGKEKKTDMEKQRLQEQPQSYDTSSKPHGDDDNADNDNDNDDHPEQRLHEALQLLEEEVRELRASYQDLTEDLEVLTLEAELLRKRQQVPEAKRSTNSASNQAVDNDLESLNRKKKQIQEQLRKVIDCLEEKADLVMVLQEQALQEQHKQQDSRELLN